LAKKVIEIADFGEALEIPKLQDNKSGAKRYARGDNQWWPPVGMTFIFYSFATP